MSQPKDLVSPDEIVAYIQERKVSEKAAAGIKLLRRAAETIAWQQDQLNSRVPTATKAPIVAENETDPAPPQDDTLDQVALALGADFIENLPWQYTLEDVLEYIANMHVQLSGLQQGIIQRDEIIQRYEQPAMRMAEASADDKAPSVGCDSVGGDTITEEWIWKANEFAHKVYGFALAIDNGSGIRLKGLAEDIIETSPVK